MTPRDRRLVSDLRAMEQLAVQRRVTFRSEGTPPDRYEVLFAVPGLGPDAKGRPAVRRMHRCSLYLHRDYPRRPPVATWLTPVFHPNLLPPSRNGGVCIGAWSAAESLADLCVRLHDLVGWRAFNVADALDREAAAWAMAHDVRPGADVAELAALPPSAERELAGVRSAPTTQGAVNG